MKFRALQWNYHAEALLVERDMTRRLCRNMPNTEATNDDTSFPNANDENDASTDVPFPTEENEYASDDVPSQDDREVRPFPYSAFISYRP